MEERLALVALPTRSRGCWPVSSGLLALGMAVIGVYGVVSYGVGQRRREIGVRLALGATGRDVTVLVVRQSVVVAAVGVGVGLVLAAGCVAAGPIAALRLSPLDRRRLPPSSSCSRRRPASRCWRRRAGRPDRSAVTLREE
jgi:hypothetical protein